jgi:hypothetical protein
MPENLIKDHLTELANKSANYQKFADYYGGNHPLNFATDKFKRTFGDKFGTLKDNLCPIVVDTPVDRLEIVNFSTEAANSSTSDEAWTIWTRNLMTRNSAEVHREAFKKGDAYLIVWADAAGKAKFYPNRAEQISVKYDEETGKITSAAKVWKSGKKYRLNLYFADRIEKFITAKETNTVPNDEKSFVPFVAEGESDSVIPHELGEVSVFHFGNAPQMSFFGISELLNVTNLQDALNKSLCDLFVTSEFVAFPKRWATGIEPEIGEDGKPTNPFQADIDRLWIVANEQAKFGQFDASDLSGFLKVQDSLRAEIARISGTPLHYFNLLGGDIPSGEALKTLESRFQAKIKNAQLSFGAIWANAMRLALKIENKQVGDLTVTWANALPRSEKETLETALLEAEVGKIAPDLVLAKIGYTKEDIAAVREFNQAARDSIVNAFNAGE